MSKFRLHSNTMVHNLFGSLTKVWGSSSHKGSLDNYIVKHGVFHLMIGGRTIEAERIMLDLQFMSRFVHSWLTVVEPLKAWRVVGIKKAELGYKASFDVQNLPSEYFLIRELCILFENVGCISLAIDALEHLTSSNPDNLSTVRHLARLYSLVGDVDSAVTLLKKSIPFVKTDSEKVQLFQSIGKAFEAKGLYAQAKEYIHHSLDILNSTGERGWEYFQCKYTLAYIFRSERNWRESKQTFIEALSVADEIDLDSFPQTLAAAKNQFGWVLLNLGEIAEAEQFIKEAVEIFSHNYGRYHMKGAAAFNNLATIYTHQKRYDDAIRIFEIVYKIYSNDLGVETPYALTALNNVGVVHFRNDNLELSSDVLGQVLIQRTSILGSNHTETLNTLSTLAVVCYQLSQYPRACHLFDRHLKAEIEIHGHRHPCLKWSYSWLVKCHIQLDNPVETATNRRHCWEIESREDGLAAVGTLQTAFALTEDLLAIGRHQEAMGVVESSLEAIMEADVKSEGQQEWIEKLKGIQKI